MEINFKNTILETLDIQVVQKDPNKVVLSMPVGPKTCQPMGMLHGGASVVLAESAASLGSYLNINPMTHQAAGIEINANHVRSTSSGIVTATATPYHLGKTSMVWEIRIVDEADKLICISRCTVAILELANGHKSTPASS
jgi:1,4-dihydroxy-2-naphthoyl-CoA hydrolase